LDFPRDTSMERATISTGNRILQQLPMLVERRRRLPPRREVQVVVNWPGQERNKSAERESKLSLAISMWVPSKWP
jgi:hypothetical protein